MPDGSIYLFGMNQRTEPPSMNGLVLVATDASRSNVAPEEVVRRAAHGFVDRDPSLYELLSEPFPVVYGGRQFFRSEYKQNLQKGGDWYFAYTFTKFRGYFLGAIITTSSPDALNNALDSLQGLTFAADQVNPSCIVGDKS